MGTYRRRHLVGQDLGGLIERYGRRASSRVVQSDVPADFSAPPASAQPAPSQQYLGISPTSQGGALLSTLQNIIDPVDWLPDAFPIGLGSLPTAPGPTTTTGSASPKVYDAHRTSRITSREPSSSDESAEVPWEILVGIFNLYYERL